MPKRKDNDGTATAGPPSKRPRDTRYSPGQHGFKGNEQKRLNAHAAWQTMGMLEDQGENLDGFGEGMREGMERFRSDHGPHDEAEGLSPLTDPVSGKTHESEHVIGFEPLIRESGLVRGDKGRARKLEDEAFAYQEQKEFHRSHIGTGNTGGPDESKPLNKRGGFLALVDDEYPLAGIRSDQVEEIATKLAPVAGLDLESAESYLRTVVQSGGFNSSGSYRDSQRTALESADPSTAVQLNQLVYAFNPDFQRDGDITAERRAADNSYDVMATSMDSVTYAQGGGDVTIPVSPVDRAEMYLARRAAQTGRWPTDEINEARKGFGLGPQGSDQDTQTHPLAGIRSDQVEEIATELAPVAGLDLESAESEYGHGEYGEYGPADPTAAPGEVVYEDGTT